MSFDGLVRPKLPQSHATGSELIVLPARVSYSRQSYLVGHLLPLLERGSMTRQYERLRPWLIDFVTSDLPGLSEARVGPQPERQHAVKIEAAGLELSAVCCHLDGLEHPVCHLDCTLSSFRLSTRTWVGAWGVRVSRAGSLGLLASRPSRPSSTISPKDSIE